MSVIKVNNITNLSGTSGPVIAGIATVSTTSHMVVPTGNTGQKVPLAPDPYIDNLVLALPFNSESVFTDVTGNITLGTTGLGVTTLSLEYGVSGLTTTSTGITTFSKYYGSSCYFDRDYYSADNGSQLRGRISGGFGVDDFTLEYWAYHTTFTNFNTHFGTTRGSNGFNVGSDGSGDFVFFDQAGISGRKIEVVGAVSLNTWNHWAFVRKDGTVYGYLDGVLQGSYTHTTIANYSSEYFTIGSLESNAEFIDGYLQDLRIYKGVAKYTSNFTPPNQIAL